MFRPDITETVDWALKTNYMYLPTYLPSLIFFKKGKKEEGSVDSNSNFRREMSIVWTMKFTQKGRDCITHVTRSSQKGSLTTTKSRQGRYQSHSQSIPLDSFGA